MPHQCGVSFGTPPSPADCRGLSSDMLFFVGGDALGIPSFNFSNAASTFRADWRGFLRSGFEQFVGMDIDQFTRAGQINVNGLETDVLYPFDWCVRFSALNHLTLLNVWVGIKSNFSLLLFPLKRTGQCLWQERAFLIPTQVSGELQHIMTTSIWTIKRQSCMYRSM